MPVKPSIFVESTARRCSFRSEVIELSQWFFWSDFRRRFWLDNGHFWWYASALFDIIDALTISLFILERIFDVMKWCFLFALVKEDVFKVILLQIWLILSSRNEDVKKRLDITLDILVSPYQRHGSILVAESFFLHELIHYQLFVDF